jgi:hypothetical protein
MSSHCNSTKPSLEEDSSSRHTVTHSATPSSTKRRLEEDSSSSTQVKKRATKGQTKKQILDSLPEEVRDVYSKHWSSIKTHHRPGKNQAVHTFMWDPTENAPEWNNFLTDVFHSQNKRFKINFSHSFLLKNKESGDLSFYHASANNHSALPSPRLINSKQDFTSFLDEIQDTDILGHVQKERPSSNYAVEKIMSTSFYLYPLSDFPIGCGCDDLPPFITNNRFIHTLQKDENHGFVYQDGLCLFRCLALHRGASKHSLQSATKELYCRWAGTPKVPLHFAGVTLFDLESVEDCFGLNIDVFEFLDSESTPYLIPKRRSAYKHTDTVRLLLFKQHFMYIVNIDKVCKALACSKCQKLYKNAMRLNEHEKSCSGPATKQQYQGGVYNTSQSVLSDLRQYGIDVDDKFVFPYRATFDFECFFQGENLPQCKSGGTVFTAQHVPMSASVASNVPDYDDARCFISEGDPQGLVSAMVRHLEDISDASYALLRQDFDGVFMQLDELDFQQKLKEDGLNAPVDSLRDRLEDYLHELPVVGFNSSRYDINVIKPYLIQALVTDNQKIVTIDLDGDDDNTPDTESRDTGIKFVVKRNNQYMCIATSKLRFLDIVNFLAPGFSYSKYLKAFHVSEEKGFFPYEYMTSLDKLDEPSLPPHSAFYSSLKKTNISEEEYAYCQRVWTDHSMTSLRQFLSWYNTLDVTPFLEALEKQISMYHELGVDLLKDGISVPGITLKYLFNTLPSDTFFSLFGEKQKEIHSLLREHLVGGPSLIFHRYHETGKTCIRGNADKPVNSIQGYDANALYLWALSQDMPTEHPIIRRKETEFKAEYTDMYGKQAREWLEYTAHSNKIHIQHKHNAKEMRLGQKRYAVDGWDKENNTVYQFHGCLVHGHENCKNTRGKTYGQFGTKTLAELRQDTHRVTDYLRKEVGVTVNEMWECQWECLKEKNAHISGFVQKHFPQWRSFPTSLDEQGILNAVFQGTFFGLLQCDVTVPDYLKDYFSELQPIFKNTLVSKDDIGPFMKDYAERHKFMSQPRKTLVASYFGKQIVLATPLLRWYLAHGLVVSNITLMIEYNPKPCFETFADSVSDARRQGDSDESKTILADTYKLLGNSAYGKTLTNLTNHRDVHYVTSDKTSKLVNEPRFQKLTELTEEVCEVEMAKKNINWGLPLQIGFFVYQYAKLRMLQFHFDFVDRFVSRQDYQLLEMDTDSLYMALSTSSLQEAVRPQLRAQFFDEYNHWFPALACDGHSLEFQKCGMTGKPFHPCADCLTRQRFDKRTPGLFKTEFSGKSFVGLCSKTYFCEGEERNNKLSCKGLSKTQNSLSMSDYKQVLSTRESGGGQNQGFRTDGKSMFTYIQSRRSLSFLYIKRIIGSDGITTYPTSV